MRFKLRVIQGALKRPDGRSLGAEIPVPARRFVIGTAPDCQMRCSGQSISPHHCMILVEDDRVVVRDDASQGGTFVNGLRIDPTACLFHGDRLRVGKLEFDVVMSSTSRPLVVVQSNTGQSNSGQSNTGQSNTMQALAVPPPVASLPTALPQSQRDTVAGQTDTVANLVVDMLLNADEAERERRRFDPAAREFHPPSESEPKPENGTEELGAKTKPPLKRPPAKLPAPPPVRGQNTIDAAQQALSQLLTPATRKKSGSDRH